MSYLKECSNIYLVFFFHFLQGVVNDRFNAMVGLNNTVERRDRVVQQIETYFADVGLILAEMSLDV